MPDFNSLSTFSKTNYIFICIQFGIGVVGIILNILVICVFSRKNLRDFSYSFYCKTKSCSDLIILFYVFRNWGQFVMDADLDIVTQVVCVINKVMPHLASIFSLFILVVISLDRLLAVLYPNRFAFLKRRWFQAAVLPVAALYSCGLNLVLPLNTQYVVSQVGNQTVRSCVVPAAITVAHSWIRNINLLTIILIINNAINIKLIGYIVSSRKKVAANGQIRGSRKERKMIVSAIGVGFAALVLKLPQGTVQIANNYLKLPSDQNTLMVYTAITFQCLEYWAMFLVNMFFNSMFSLEFWQMFGMRRSQQVSTTGNKRSNTNNKSNKTNNNNTNISINQLD